MVYFSCPANQVSAGRMRLCPLMPSLRSPTYVYMFAPTSDVEAGKIRIDQRSILWTGFAGTIC